MKRYLSKFEDIFIALFFLFIVIFICWGLVNYDNYKYYPVTYEYSSEEINNFPEVDLGDVETKIYKDYIRVRDLRPDEKYQIVIYFTVNRGEKNSLVSPRMNEKMYRIKNFEPVVIDVEDNNISGITAEYEVPVNSGEQVVIFSKLVATKENK